MDQSAVILSTPTDPSNSNPALSCDLGEPVSVYHNVIEHMQVASLQLIRA